MEYHPKGYEQLIESISSKEAEPSRSELAEFMSFVIQQKGAWSKISELMSRIDPEEREGLAAELSAVSSEVGWKMAGRIFSGDLSFLKTMESFDKPKDNTDLYNIRVKRPEEIKDASSFFERSEGTISFWVPEKVDIRRFLAIAVEGHLSSGKSGPVSIIDVGGGSGFVAKLIADEAKEAGLDVEVTVIDPDIDEMENARKTYQDTDNLHFQDGDAFTALKMFGPELSADKLKEFDDLESQRSLLVKNGREELTQIRALQKVLESAANINEVLKGPFGERAAGILSDAGAASAGDIDTVRSKLSFHYQSLYEELSEQCLNIRNKQEIIYSSVDSSESRTDMVLNSWMPLGLDFTRELRWISSPSIVYSKDRIGGCGCGYEDIFDRKPSSLGKEESFESGELYDISARWANYDCNGTIGNDVSVQVRKGAFIDLSTLNAIKVEKKKKYPWEFSLPNTGQKRYFKIYQGAQIAA